MAHSSTLIADDINAYLISQERKDPLRFITCGSVDDGRSTLIGRLLYDSKLVFEDQRQAVDAESRKFGTQGDKIDLALLVDGLQAEREQGITIDVAYRYFSTDKRKFIVADTPGHEQSTQNMVTGASTAELAIILVDARKGIQTQTRRHTYLASLLGIKHVVLAINKIDLVDFEQAPFETISSEYRLFASSLGIDDIRCIPISALDGDNVLTKSERTDWYKGPALMQTLETIEVQHTLVDAAFRMPVQWVNRPNSDFRGYAGTIASGRIAEGDAILVCPAETPSRVKRISTADGDLKEAIAGQSVTLVLADEVDASRGDVIADAAEPCEQTDQFAGHVIWTHERPMLPERQYLIKIGTQQLTAQVTDLRYTVNVDTLEHVAAKKLELNDIGYANFSLDRSVAFDPYEKNRDTGSFILIDKFTNETVGAGLVSFGLRRATNLTWHTSDVNKESRSHQKGQRPCMLWFTGLSGSGKSTVANALEQKLRRLGRHSYLLDGDNVRHGLNKDLGFTDQDRVENIRRVAEVSKLMVDAGLVVLVSFISPFRSERDMARGLVEEGEFIEVFVDTPIAVCEQRDPKGLYKKARAGEIKNFTGIDSAYEAPESPEINLASVKFGAEALADQLIEYLKDGGYV
jgi:bifunctional enzyme CysN/CysC